ncbi:MAG: hypothetical protein E7I97_04460, partial [Lactococcus lactis]|nr:hypothetical protein [Lactococcus lactis]
NIALLAASKVSEKDLDRSKHEALIENFINDFQNQNLFIGRAIKLAQKEEKFSLELAIRKIYGYNLSIIRYFAGELGKTIGEFIEEEDDD